MDYGIFDGLMDYAVFVANENLELIYGNEEAARLCDSSVRRMARSKPMVEFIKFQDSDLVSNGGDKGRTDALPMMEIECLVGGSKSNKVQVSSQPFTSEDGKPHWIFIVRSVTLEEILQGKYREQLEAKEEVINELRDAQEKLEDYSRNLEKMVEERTAEVKRANKMLQAIMNSLGQGFLVFDESGQCADIYTKACEWILESRPEGKAIWDVLSLDKANQEQFKKWMGAVYSEALPFDSLKSLAPDLYEHSENKHITLDYFDLKGENESKNIVLVATDKTAEHEAQIALQKEREHAKMILKLISNKNHFEQFLLGCKNRLEEIDKTLMLEGKEFQSIDYNHLFRELHTIEGEAAAFSLLDIRHSSRECQKDIEPFRGDSPNWDRRFFDDFVSHFELLKKSFSNFKIENQALLETVGIGSGNKIEISEEKLETLLKNLRAQGVSEGICQGFVENLQMKPLIELVRHLDDVVQVVAEKQGKQVAPIDFSFGGIEVAPGKFDGLVGALVHAFRNAVDHGLEVSEEREFCGKPAQGTISFSCERKADRLHFKIKDDGQGIDPEVIRRKVKESNPDLNLNEMDDHQVLQFIFNAGFSSRSEVGEFSGRGVGMDAIRYEVERLGGQISVSSVPGEGTEVSFDVPDSHPTIDLVKSA